MIQLDHVSKWYFAGEPVLSDVNLKLERGDFLYLIGGSGAGKSSLLRILSTEENQSEGKVSLFGYDLKSARRSTLRQIRRSIGTISQNPRLVSDFSILDNILLPWSVQKKDRPGASIKNKIEHILGLLGLSEKSQTLACNLSGGEAQRVAVARALILEPELLLADEPTGAQDRDHTWGLVDTFLKLNQQKVTVVLATHDREMVRRVRKKCGLLKEGRFVMEDSGWS